MDTKRNGFFEAFEGFLVGVAIVLLVLLSLIYLAIPSLEMIDEGLREYLRDVIGNLVPTILVFILAYLLLYRRIQKLRSEQEAERFGNSIAERVVSEMRRAAEITKSIERTGRCSIPLTDLAWLYDGNDILAQETQIFTDVWVVTPHLLNDTGTEYETTPGGISTVTVVQDNLRRRTNYTFVVPATPAIQALLPQLQKNYSNRRGRFHIVAVPVDVFDSLASTEIAIYDPYMKQGRVPLVFLELPVEPTHRYWAQLAEEAAAVYVARGEYY